MQNNPKISIIVPVYNTDKFLYKCIDSILSQTFTDFECILINDGSTDNSAAICDEYSKKDNRIKVIHQKNAGVSAARNAGLDIACGEWIGFVDSDDWCDPEMYEFLLSKALKYQADISICRFRKVKENSILNIFSNEDLDIVMNSKEALTKLFSKGYFQGHLFTKLIKKQLFFNQDKKLYFNEDIKFSEDRLLLYFLLKNAKIIFYSKNIYYNYLQHSNSVVIMYKKLGLTPAYITRFNAFEIMLDNEEDKMIKRLIKIMLVKFSIKSYLKHIWINGRITNNDISNIPKYIIKKYILFILVYCNIKQKLSSIFVIFPHIYYIYIFFKKKKYKYIFSIF
jgi:glycosyltransferase involved in cell wall biosynthesis